MAKITYRHPDGTVTVLEVPNGNSVMRGAVINGVRGIVGECGGGAMCGTCHVYIAEDSTAPLPPMPEIEHELLHTTACERRDSSRLSCQLPVTDDIDGLVVDMPERQL
ncbi:ferredoxin [Streptomyces sp. CB03234]|uniref:2Fe-2S iron-sulfur cluster-binding protein n=1 Tax=Streptomyces sp. (strain CB03234) TaxID=1703937 RepID=UPI00093FF839|nr:2Fe-2S iron-sulfur cluster-binding protein [Streptomyces sp. CB03234]OKJ94689.1 ferredoxin [Streptomyces sp. CB03234]